MQKRLTRRAFLQSTGDAARVSCIALTLPMIVAACSNWGQSKNTVLYFYSDPNYLENIGYQLIGFEDQSAWQSPFGFYDADYMAKGE